MPFRAGGADRGVERLLFFSDAVFAIAITLLVIDLRVPSPGHELSNEELGDALLGLAMRVFAYVLSFAVIGIYWHAHWRGFEHLVRVDTRLAVLNLALLGVIAFVPFPTALIGEYGDRPVAVLVYALTVAAAGVIGPAAWSHAQRAGLVEPALAPQELRLALRRALALPAVMVASLLLLPFAPTSVVELMWFAIVPVQAVLARRRR